VSCDTTVPFQNLTISTASVNYLWDFGDGQTSTTNSPIHNYSQSGLYEITLIATDAGACNLADTIIKEIYILSNYSDTIQSIFKCPNELVQIGLLPVNDTGISYLWSPSNNLSSTNISNPFCDINSDTQYQLLISNGTCTDTLIQDIIILNVTVDAGLDTIFCSDPVVLNAVVSNSVSAISWSTNSDFTTIIGSSSDLSISEIGTYYISVSDGNCEVIDSVNVVSNNNLQLSTSQNNVFCNDSTQISATYSTDVSFIVWSSNKSFSDTLGVLDSLSVFSSGVFYVKVINGVCEQVDSIEVLSESINIDIISNDICIGDSVLIEIQNLNSSIPITVYNWSGFTQNSSSIFVTPDSSRWYSVEVENTNGCIASDSTFINVFYYPIIDSLWLSDSIVYEGATVELNVIIQDTTHIYNIVANENYWYTFEVSNLFGCSVIDSVYIQTKDVFCDDKNIKIPTAFSPNNDGKNDNYYIKDEDGVITNFHLEIFNRFGQKVFAINDKTTKWNGEFNGEKLPPQVFDFYLEISCIGAKTLFHKGNITLIR